MPRGPSEAEETAVSADGTEVAFFFPSVNCSGTRAFKRKLIGAKDWGREEDLFLAPLGCDYGPWDGCPSIEWAAKSEVINFLPL